MVARLQALAALSAHAAQPAQPGANFWRSLQTLNATRIVIALVLLVYLSFDGRGLRASGHYLYLWICLTYLALALVFALAAVYWPRRFLAQMLAAITCDLAVISLLYVDGGGLHSGMAILYLFPLAGTAILAPLVLALFCSALTTLFMLGVSVLQVLAMDGDDSRIVLQSGLYGAVYFAVVLVVNRLAARLIGQEALAARRGVEVAVQQAVNRLVMADVGDGILVVDPDGFIWAGNPAAQQMLGMHGVQPQAALSGAAALAPLARAHAAWRADPAQATVFVTIKPDDDPALAPAAAWPALSALSTRLRVRFAAVDTAGLGVERSVIFLQDVSEIEERAQQLKLASMGRLTASIAHEVRNPLSAIGHANALLAEDIDDARQRRLLTIVSDNVARVNRIVEDILQLSRKSPQRHAPLALDDFLAGLRAEMIDTEGVAADVIALSVAPGTLVHFDPFQLREVLANLVGNALRYASMTPASIRLTLQAQSQRLELHVQDDGPGISNEVRAHLFEPFYTTSSKGTGLGLYLARELCLNNEARLDYEYRFDSHDSQHAGRRSSGRFVITFAATPQ
ncbi:MAG: HAMP domain-containing sensor histidine kinase [Duganella sp.]